MSLGLAALGLTPLGVGIGRAAATGGESTSAVGSIAEAADGVAGSISVQINASVALNEAPDTLAASAAATSGIAAAASISEVGDSIASTVSVTISITGAIAEAGDGVAGSAVVAGGVTAGANINEQPDTLQAEIELGAPPAEVYARAPSGSGYSPRRDQSRTRPSQVGESRPYAIQDNDR